MKSIQIKTNVEPVGIEPRRQLPMYPINPFMDMSVHSVVEEISIEPSKANTIVASQCEQDRTTIAQVEFLENEQFIKVFTRDTSWMLGFDSPGIKVFTILLEQIQQTAVGKGSLYLNFRNAKNIAKKMGISCSESTFNRGVRNLCEKNVIALSQDPGWLFINPAVIFNGDRADFVKSYRKIPAKGISEEPPAQVPILKDTSWKEREVQRARTQRAKVAL